VSFFFKSLIVPSSGFDITTHRPLGGIDSDEQIYGDLVTKSFFVPANNIGDEDEEDEEGSDGNLDILQPVMTHQKADWEGGDDNDNASGYNPVFDEEAGEVWDSEGWPRGQQGSQLAPIPNLEGEFVFTATSTPQRKRGTKLAATAIRSRNPTPAPDHPPLSSLAVPADPTETRVPSPPAVPDATIATRTVTKPKPKRVMSKWEREQAALAAVADGERMGDPGPLTQDQRATRRSTRNTNDAATSSTTTNPPPALAIPRQMVGDAPEAGSSSARAAPERDQGGKAAETAGRGAKRRGGKPKKGGA
jgi:hypothetical protein